MKMDGLYLAVSMNLGWFPLRRLYHFRGCYRPPLMPGVMFRKSLILEKLISSDK